MELIIKKNRTLSELKADFNRYFSFLKIEFCTKPHRVKEGTSKKFFHNTDKKLSEISTKIKEVSVEINETMTVGSLENIFQNEIGLPIQVFRKSGPSWLETTSTDDWSLEKQNSYGLMLSTKIHQESVKEFDNDATK